MTATGTLGPAFTTRRRFDELLLLVLVGVLAAGGYALTLLSERTALTGSLAPRLGAVMTLFLAAHLAVRRFAPEADATLLPLAALLDGIGFIFVARLDPELAAAQTVWTGVGISVFILTLAIVKQARSLERYRYTFALLGIVTLLLPAVPGLGREVNGARLWVRVAGLNFQPAEVAKVVLVVFFAAYLIEKREVLAVMTRRLGRLPLPDPRHLGPLLLAWGVSLVIMVQEKDLGSSLLFFAVFAVMLYLATGRGAYLVIAGLMFVTGATVAYRVFDHVAARVTTWLDPWPLAQGLGFQLVQALYAFGSGGFAGTGFGLGHPDQIPNAATDFVFAAIGEELGILGAVAVLAVYLLFVGSGFRVALRAERPFLKLLAAGLTTIVGVQTFIILGGVTRVIPLTGITLPFISYGGSSLVANFALLALLLRVSDESGGDETVIGQLPAQVGAPAGAQAGGRAGRGAS
ncbi:MAG: FtsW/RodA/SpoVE family cell cycle protein [Actinobacteria bacterium]|nr:FtsW/RodA/SpoVE family cell cycle protein [Actinomycetota bacterium]